MIAQAHENAAKTFERIKREHKQHLEVMEECRKEVLELETEACHWNEKVCLLFYGITVVYRKSATKLLVRGAGGRGKMGKELNTKAGSFCGKVFGCTGVLRNKFV